MDTIAFPEGGYSQVEINLLTSDEILTAIASQKGPHNELHDNVGVLLSVKYTLGVRLAVVSQPSSGSPGS